MDQERAAFLAERNTGIGGSDAPVILGLSTYKTPLQLWAERTGRLEPQGDSAILRRGRKLEVIVASEYEEETGRQVLNVDGHQRHPDLPWLIGHVDRWVKRFDDRGEGVLECKSANVFRISDWQEEAPLPSQVQLQHYLAVTGMEWGSVAGLLGGIEFKYQDIERNDAFISSLIEKEATFWNLIQEDTPPEPSAQDSTLLNRLWAAVEGESVTLDADALAWDADLVRLKAEIKQLEDLKTEAEAKLKFAIGHAEAAVLPDGTVYTFKTQERAEHVVKATSFRVLRRKSR